MKKLVLSLFLLALAVLPATAQSSKGKKLQHVVLFKFKDDAPAEQVKKVEEAFRKLPSQIKEIKGFEWGLNNSPENLNQGFTHCFLVSFASEKDRETYLPHPKHQEFVALLKPVLDKVLVIDYWAEK
jgi:Stress responsive A/B Barrel Domain